MDLSDGPMPHPSDPIPNEAYPDAPGYRPGTNGGNQPQDPAMGSSGTAANNACGATTRRVPDIAGLSSSEISSPRQDARREPAWRPRGLSFDEYEAVRNPPEYEEHNNMPGLPGGIEMQDRESLMGRMNAADYVSEAARRQQTPPEHQPQEDGVENVPHNPQDEDAQQAGVPRVVEGEVPKSKWEGFKRWYRSLRSGNILVIVVLCVAIIAITGGILVVWFAITESLNQEPGSGLIRHSPLGPRPQTL